MAPPAGTLRVRRYFLALLAIVAALYAIVFWPGQRHTPKLGIDLAGGLQVVFTAKAPNGQPPTKASMLEAKQILTDRVNGSGVTQATVIIEGSNRLVVSIPGSTTTDVSKLGQAAKLNFRGLVMPSVPVTCATVATPGVAPSSAAPSRAPSGSAPSGTAPSSRPSAGSGSAAPKSARERPLTAASPSPSAPAKSAATVRPAATAKPSGTSAPTAAVPSASSAAPVPCTATPLTGLAFTPPTTETAFNTLTPAQQTQLKTALARFDCSAGSNEADLPNKDFIACDNGTTYGQRLAYLLGPVIVPGNQISSASAQAPNVAAGTAEWTVSLTLHSAGQASWAAYTSAHNIGGKSATTTGGTPTCGATGTPCADYVAFTLDGQVISAPVNIQAINGGATQISGSFTAASATDLATKLKYGALPLSFTPGSAQQVSPTLGTSQLKAGLLAGGIGLVLVVIYSLIYYRALGLVTIGSLVVSGVLTYGALVMLGTQMGFTLSLAGIAGFIVAIGITADSFVVFFERMKDEVHEGRSMRVAVPRAWVRARRTILSADTVSFLAAAILYYFAAGDVRGFAFTLGLSTVLDLVVVFLFTHPLVSALSRSRTFGSSRFTGLDAVRDGGVAVAEAEPAPRPRRTTPSAAAAREESAGERFAGVAVLDRPTATVEHTAADEVTEPRPAGGADGGVDDDIDRADGRVGADAVGAAAGDLSEAAVAADDVTLSPVDPDPDAATDAAPGRRADPAPGSAAERAAARRARLRAAGTDEEGNR